jgi:hypothetical protein
MEDDGAGWWRSRTVVLKDFMRHVRAGYDIDTTGLGVEADNVPRQLRSVPPTMELRLRMFDN